MALSDTIKAALETEARDILQRIVDAAESPHGKALIRRFEERLGHLAERLGKDAFAAIVSAIKPAPSAPPAPVVVPTPAAVPPKA